MSIARTQSNAPAVSNEMLDEVSSSLSHATICITNSTKQLREAYQQDVSLMTYETVQYRRTLFSNCFMYGKYVFPYSVTLVENIKDVLENYLDLEYKDFAESLEEIRDDCRRYSEFAREAHRAHLYVLSRLKSLDNELHRKVSVLTSHAIDARNRAETMKKVGTTAKSVGTLGIAVGAALVPIDGGITLGLSLAGAGAAFYGDNRSSAAEKEQAIGQVSSHSAGILQRLIHSLEDFTAAVEIVAEFVVLLESELRIMAKIGVGREFKMLHFRKMARKARDIVGNSARFIMIKPVIMSDLLSVREVLEEGFEEKWMGDARNIHLRIEDLHATPRRGRSYDA